MHPYEGLSSEFFWKTAIASKSMFEADGLWKPKFDIDANQRIATYGSCFAQHIGKALDQQGFHWLRTELAPTGLSEENQRLYGYELFSARTGNIYTTSSFRQWIEWALGNQKLPEEIWEHGDRYFDPFRPRIEPGGFATRDEVRNAQAISVRAVAKSIEQANVLIFTLGLTENWFNLELGYEYPLCPGTAAGTFHGEIHRFRNLSFQEVKDELVRATGLMRVVNKDLKILLTVSPVPLTATFSGKHVLSATTHSKSLLRAVAGEMAAEYEFVDYFPSYEIISSPVFKGSFFEPNLRSVSQFGVDFVMKHFFSSILGSRPDNLGVAKPASNSGDLAGSDLVCEEEILDAFGT